MALKNSDLFKLKSNLLGRRKASRLASGQSGFTIVELLIVIVVIAILAAITIVAYNGISSQAKESALKSDLTTAAKKLHVEKVGTDSFPSSKPGYISSDLDYSGTSSTFCVTGKAGTKDFFIDEVGNVSEGGCPLPPATTMQSLTQAHCSALTTFTGSNADAIQTLTDARGGTTRTYEIAKLADNKCWMLNNMKLGSETGSTTLTPADSDVVSNFTLPQVSTGGSSSDDNPTVSGPVPGDTGTGATNYGYLYNWPAATAGETRTSHDNNMGSAPYSICPANWRLPTSSATGEFAWLNAKMNNPGATSPSTAYGSGYYQNWQSTGPFRGAFSGYWRASFRLQGDVGRLWSASAHPSSSDVAFYVNLTPSHVDSGGGTNRSSGLGVRCLLN